MPPRSCRAGSAAALPGSVQGPNCPVSPSSRCDPSTGSRTRIPVQDVEHLPRHPEEGRGL